MSGNTNLGPASKSAITMASHDTSRTACSTNLDDQDDASIRQEEEDSSFGVNTSAAITGEKLSQPTCQGEDLQKNAGNKQAPEQATHQESPKTLPPFEEPENPDNDKKHTDTSNVRSVIDSISTYPPSVSPKPSALKSKSMLGSTKNVLPHIAAVDDSRSTDPLCSPSLPQNAVASRSTDASALLFAGTVLETPSSAPSSPTNQYRPSKNVAPLHGSSHQGDGQAGNHSSEAIGDPAVTLNVSPGCRKSAPKLVSEEVDDGTHGSTTRTSFAATIAPGTGQHSPQGEDMKNNGGVLQSSLMEEAADGGLEESSCNVSCKKLPNRPLGVACEQHVNEGNGVVRDSLTMELGETDAPYKSQEETTRPDEWRQVSYRVNTMRDLGLTVTLTDTAVDIVHEGTQAHELGIPKGSVPLSLNQISIRDCRHLAELWLLAKSKTTATLVIKQPVTTTREVLDKEDGGDSTVSATSTEARENGVRKRSRSEDKEAGVVASTARTAKGQVLTAAKTTATTTATATVGRTWTCIKCGSVNPAAKARCGPLCRLWRGGKRPKRRRPDNSATTATAAGVPPPAASSYRSSTLDGLTFDRSTDATDHERDPEYYLIGKGIVQEWTDVEGRNKFVYGTVTGGGVDDQGEVFVTVKYSKESRLDANSSPSVCGSQVPECRKISYMLAVGGCDSFAKEANTYRKTQPGWTWMTPKFRQEELIDAGYGITLPRLTLTCRGFRLVFDVKESTIPGAGYGVFVKATQLVKTNDGDSTDNFELEVGEFLDLGIYAPFRVEDRKKERVFFVKNYVHSFKCEEYGFNTADENFEFDITDDTTGDVHEMARSHIPLYVNECRTDEISTVRAEYDPEGNVHYLFGIGDGEKLSIPGDGTETELFVDYGPTYEQVRLRKGYSHLPDELKAQKFRELEQNEEEYVNEIATGFNLDDIGACVEFFHVMFRKDGKVFATEAGERALRVAEAFDKTVTALQQSGEPVSLALVQSVKSLVSLLKRLFGKGHGSNEDDPNKAGETLSVIV